MYKIFFPILISTLILGTNSFPQTFGIGGGFSIVTGPDTYTKSYNHGGVGYTSGYHIGPKLKIDIPILPITPVGFFTYSRFSSNELTSNGNLKTSQIIWSIGAGGEYQLFTVPLISPYLSADLAYADFGDFNSEGVVNEIGIIGQSIILGSRFGGAIGIGAEIFYHFDVSIKYHFLNWLGKDPGEETVSMLSYNLTILL